MRVIFFGTPAFAAPTLAALIASRHQVVAVVTQPDRARGRGQKVTFSPVKELALAHGLPVFQPEKLTAEAIAELRGLSADIGVVAAYGKILPQALLDVPPQGLINVHASLLPRWRGAAPIHRAILAGDAVTGVTIMRVVFALDAGPMLSRGELPIGPDVTSDALERELADAGARLLVDTLDGLESGRVIDTPQDESLVTYAKKIERADSPIDWAKSADGIHNQIRGLHPWPMAATTFRGRRVIVRASHLAPWNDIGAAPGTLVEIADESIRVATGAGTLHITRLQPENRRALSALEFANGLKVSVGERFE